MRAAHSYTNLSATHLPARAPQSPTDLRLGLATVVGLTTAFWVLALQVASQAVDIAISTPALTAFGIAIAVWCFVGAGVVMAGRD